MSDLHLGAGRVVALIPARGGSKGIPRKNLVKLGGVPLVARSIRASLRSRVDETWLSTEDAEIARVAEAAGARVLFRPAELAVDDTSTEAVMIHFTEHVQFESLVLLQCTCPFTTPEDIDTAIAMLEDYDSVFTVTRVHQFVWSQGTANYDPRYRPRRQEAPVTYLETGGLYAVTRETLLRERCRIGGRIGFLEVPRSRSIDIDSPEDLRIAAAILEQGVVNVDLPGMGELAAEGNESDT